MRCVPGDSCDDMFNIIMKWLLPLLQVTKFYNLSFYVLQVWFQNQRAKLKKIQKKQQLNGSKIKQERKSESAADDSSENESKSPIKIKTEDLNGKIF